MLGKALTTAAAGNAAGEALYVEDVFSTYLYTGTGSTQTITNGIDLDGEGGLVWLKSRTGAYNHYLATTPTGFGWLYSNTTDAVLGSGGSTFSFNSDGWTTTATGVGVNGTGNDYVSWTFRKAPKFFDVVTYTGTGVARTVAHNLGSVPGCIIVKCTSSSRLWAVYHRGHNGGTNPEDYYARLNGPGYGVINNSAYWNDTAPTDSVFTVGTGGDVNASGSTFVAYLFAHNDGDGEFGDDGDQDIIQCGSYTGNSSTPGALVDLGFEPQAVFIVSNTTGSSTKNVIFDSMRGTVTGGDDSYLSADLSNAEASDGNYMEFDSTGFRPSYDSQNYTNVSGNVYSYIAIRRGPMKTPESGTEVFAMDEGDATDLGIKTGILTDALILGQRSGSDKYYFGSRLTGTKYLRTNTTAAEATQANQVWDRMDGAWDNNLSSYTGWGFRRAPGFFDVVAYTGDGTAGRTVAHNLGVAPEMMIVKRRDSAYGWYVYHNGNTAEPETDYLFLNDTNATADNASVWNDTAPTSSVFSLGTGFAVNQSGGTYIAYLFASLPGVSKIGTYTGNGTSQTIDCGFSSGARFVLIKRTDSTGDWHVYDSERGIVAGNDPRLELNTTDAEDTGSDDIDPVSSGFAVTSNADVNTNSAEYIFLAVS